MVVGEGEEAVGELIDAYRAARAGEDGTLRDRVLDAWKPIAGVYVPDAYRVAYAADGRIEAVTPTDATVPSIVVKRRLKDVNQFETRSILKSPRAEYGHMELLEVGKGCGRGCRFCLEGQVYRPVRHRSLESLRESVAAIAKEGKRVGLVGACVSDYPWIGELMKVLEEHGVEVSISSLRADSLTEELVASLQRGGHRTLTMAPEAGTERLRQVVRKVITDEQLFVACDLLRKYGIPNLKCYFMIGLPTETMADVAAIPDLALRMLERLRVPGPDGHPFGKLTLSISSFVPKPWTPFQWAPFDDVRALEDKLEVIKRGARKLSVRVVHENPREAGAPGAPRARRPAARGPDRLGRGAPGRLAARAPRLAGRPRVLHAPPARHGGAHAVGSLRRWRPEGRPAPRMAARGTRRGRSAVGACLGAPWRSYRWPRQVTSRSGKGVWSTRRGKRSRCSTSTARTTRSTMDVRTAAGRSARATSTAPWWRARGTDGGGNVTSGANANNPAVRVACFPVTVDGDQILVDLP